MNSEAKYRVMVVDDDPDIRMAIADTLQAKYEVVLARGGDDALLKLDDYEPDFIILDLKMPGMDGIETCKAIRHSDRFQNVQVMFLSAYGSRESISKTYEVGGNLFVPKPIEPERLLKNVDLFFEQCKPPLRTKKHSIYHIHLTEGRERAPGGGIATTAPLRHPATPPERRILEESKPTSPPESNHLFKHPPLAPRPNKPAVPPRQSGLSAQMDGPTVHVPARPTPHAHPEGGSIPMPQAAVRPRVLVVEDDPDLAQLADLALSEYFEVVRAKDGIEGLEYALKYQPDVICLDIMMPKMNGYQLCQQIRSQPTFAQTPIIVMTAKTNSRDQEYSERVGADVFLPKPFDMEKLIQVCRQFTNRPDFVVRKKSRALEQRHKGAEPELPSGPRAFSREGKIY